MSLLVLSVQIFVFPFTTQSTPRICSVFCVSPVRKKVYSRVFPVFLMYSMRPSVTAVCSSWMTKVRLQLFPQKILKHTRRGVALGSSVILLLSNILFGFVEYAQRGVPRLRILLASIVTIFFPSLLVLRVISRSHRTSTCSSGISIRPGSPARV